MVIDKRELIRETQSFLTELKKNEPRKESLEWYLINNLINYLSVLNTSKTAMEIKTATEKLDMFCIECMDWNTPLFKRCTKITDLGLKLVKAN